LLATPGGTLKDNLAGFGEFAEGVASNSPPDEPVIDGRF
jgi:hypothetical protein